MLTRFVLLILLLVFLAPATACAADKPGDWIPDDAVVVVRLKNPKAALANVKRLVDEVVPGSSQILFGEEGIASKAAPFLPDGVDWEREIWLAAFLAVNGQNVTLDVIYALPTNDAAALKKSLTAMSVSVNNQVHQPNYLVHNSMLIGSNTRTTAEKIEKCISGEGRSFFFDQSKAEQALFAANDLSISFSVENYINEVQRLPGVDPDDGKKLITDLPHDLANLYESFASEFETLPFVSEIYRILLANHVNQLLPSISGETVLDTTSLTLGVNLGKAGVSIDAFVAFREGSKTLTQSKVPPSPLADLQRLPPDRQVYVAATSFASSPTFLSPVQIEQVVVDDDKNRLVHADYQQTIKRLNKFSYGEGAVAFSLPSRKGTNEFLLTSFGAVAKPAAHRRLLNHLAATESNFTKFSKQKSYTLRGRSEQYGENFADVHLVQFQEQEDAGAGSIEKKFYGSDGIESRNLYLDERWITTVGGGRAAMQQAVHRLQQPDARRHEPAFHATRGELLPDANFVLMSDLAAIFCSMMLSSADAEDDDEVAKKFVGALDEFSTRHETSYFGVAAGMQPSGAHIKLYLPTKQAKSVSQLGQILAPLLFE